MFRYRAFFASVTLSAAMTAEVFAFADTSTSSPHSMTVLSSPPKIKAYLKVPGIKGESQDPGFRDCIDILSFHAPLGIATNVTSPRDTQTGQARVVAPLVFTKRVDGTSPLLRAQFAQGTHFTTIVFDEVSPVYGEFYELTLTNASIVRIASGAASVPSESLSLNYTQIEVKYAKLDAQGAHGALVAPPAGFDLARLNKAP